MSFHVRSFFVRGLCVLAFLASLAKAATPGIINHQGRIAVDGVNYDGTGYFKFALASPDNAFEWSNDGSSSEGSEPSVAVPVSVSKGHYAVPLGDTTFDANMNNAIPSSGFADEDEIYLRVWFSADPAGTFEELLPSQRLTSVGYALHAEKAESAVTVDEVRNPSFLGTDGAFPLIFSAANLEALSVEGSSQGFEFVLGPAYSSITGKSVNSIVLGGTEARPNSIDQSSWAAIIGGYGNLIGTVYEANASVIYGGRLNTIKGGDNSAILSSQNSTIGDKADWAAIVGGNSNEIEDNVTNSGIFVGRSNTIESGTGFATILGGSSNAIGELADYSIVAGRRARSDHKGSFVWADYFSDAGEDFVTTGENQFLIRASGGVGIGTNDPQTALQVAGTITADGFSGPLLGSLPENSVSTTKISDGSVTSAKIADGSITGAKIANGTITTSDLASSVGVFTHVASVYSIDGTMTATGNQVLKGSLVIDSDGSNEGSLSSGGALMFGDVESGEGIVSRRVAGENAVGLDFYTNHTPNMSLTRYGDVGIGTTEPDANLHISDAGNVTVHLEADSDNASETDHPLIRFSQDGGVINGSIGFFDGTNDFRIRTEDTGGGANDLILEPEGDFEIRNLASGIRAIEIAWPDVRGKGAFIQIGNGDTRTLLAGDVAESSDRNLKDDFASVDPTAILQALVQLPLSTWKFKESERRHLGPMAQDFFAAFDGLLDLQGDDTTISPVDRSGVAFASIQALNTKVESENAQLRAENAELRERLERLEAMFETLANSTDRL